MMQLGLGDERFLAAAFGLLLVLGCGDDSGPAGVRCTMSSDCAAGERCFNGFCVPGHRPDGGSPPPDASSDATAGDSATDAGSACETNLDCPPTERCVEARCVSTDVDAGGTDGGTDADSGPGCVDISGEYTICDGTECRDAVCYLSNVQITEGSAPCTFLVSSSGSTRVTGTFTVTGDQVAPGSSEFVRSDLPETCGVGQLMDMAGSIEIAFPCACTLLLVPR